jgi:hypothetical protein
MEGAGWLAHSLADVGNEDLWMVMEGGNDTTEQQFSIQH